MINIEDFTKRLQNIIDFYGESASSFAEKIGVQRSSISHILSGRNKPSLDFILKILSSYPDVELYWLLNGRGSFPAPIKTETERQTKKEVAQNNTRFTEMPVEDTAKKINTPKIEPLPLAQEKEIERIVIFYSDGTFKNFNN